MTALATTGRSLACLLALLLAASVPTTRAGPAARVSARGVEMDGPASFRAIFEVPRHAIDLQAPVPPAESAGVIAVPVGAAVGLELLAADHDDLGAPTPSGVAILPVAEVEFVPIGIVRHLNLGRIEVRPVSRDPVTGRWRALRRAEVRVTFVQGLRPPVGDRIALDPIDRHLASLVLNPATVPEAAVPAAGPGATVAPRAGAERTGASSSSSTIPAPEPSILPPVKVLVREDGLYRITREDLVAAGADPAGIDPRTFVLTCRGEGDGVFDPGDVIRFYGNAVGGEETWDNVYRLTGGIRAGLRMATRQAQTIAGAPLAASFEDLLHLETDVLYFGSIPESAPSPWLWESLATTVPGLPVFTDQTLTLSGLATSPPATARLEVHVQSRRETPGPSPNHHVRTYINGHLVADQTWTGLLGVTLAGDVPTAWLNAGSNVVRIENPSDLGLAIQTEYTDWIELTYPRRYQAVSDSLEFAGPGEAGTRRFVVTGFTGADVLLYDLTVSGQPVVITQPVLAYDGISWQVVFDESINAPPGRYLALRPAAARVPFSLVPDLPSYLRARAAEGADMLIVAADEFEPAIEPLAALRRDQGLRVVVARLTDVFDEFNGGIAETTGIRNFVQWAFENYAPPAPSALLLVGDATFDPRDNKGEGDNFLSTRFFYAPGFGYTPSDTWFAAVTGADPVPDLAVGRMTARAVADVDTQVARILAYEAAPPVAELNSGLLYVADDDDPSFPLLLEDLITTRHPPAMSVRRVYLDDFPQTADGVTAARDAIRQWIDAGSLATVYAGHGSRTAWAAESLWSVGDVPTLAPTDRLTFVASLNCVNGYFANIDVEPWSLGEQWGLSPRRGGIAAWTPSALSTLSNYQVLASDLFDQMFTFREPRLGRAAWLALLDSYLAHDVEEVNLQEMVFFGDPATRLALDWDRDGLLDRDEETGGTDRDDADSDDDGVADGAENAWNVDTDGDGLINALDYDSDNDGLPDGLERGVAAPSPSTDTGRGHFIADADPATTSNPLAADSDGGGAPDGAEDRNANGRVDAGETDPGNGLDDPTCAPAPPAEVAHLTVVPQGDDIVLAWTDQTAQDPCVLYRVYVAAVDGMPATVDTFAYVATVAAPQWRHIGAAADPRGYTYLVTATSLAHGEGPLGHYGR
jgi:hypothetical protein